MKKSILLLLSLVLFISCDNPLGKKNKDQSAFDDGHVAFPVEANLEAFAINSAVAGDTQVVLTWQESKNAKFYEVYYGTSSGNHNTKAVMCSGRSLNCTVTGLTNSQQYFFIVRAKNTKEVLDSSNELDAIPIPNDTAPVSSNITPANGSEDVESTVTLSYVDGQGDLATACIVSSLSNVTITTPCTCAAGTCTVGVTGTSNYNGAVSFSYTVTANGLTSNSAIANFNLNAVNDAPTISDVSNQTINEDGNTGALTVTINDPDNTLNCATSLSITSSNTTLIDNTDVVFAGTTPNCTATLSPNSNESGTSTITLTVTDSTSTDTDTFSLTVNAVNDAPTISDVSNQTINENGNTGALAITINDVDNTLNCATSLSMISSNTTLIDNTDIVFAGIAPNCTGTLTPNSNEDGIATITLFVDDGSTSVTDIFTLTVNSAFAPTEISNLEVWFDGQDLSTLFQSTSCSSSATPGDSVGCWLDKAKGNNAIGDGTSDPTVLGGGGINLANGTQELIFGALNSLSEISIFAVVKTASYPSGNGTFLSFRAGLGGSAEHYSWSDGHLYSYFGSHSRVQVISSSPNFPTDLSTIHMMSSYSTSGNFEMRFYGKVSHTSSPGFALSSINSSIGGNFGFSGDVYEVIIYSNQLSNSDRQNIEGYLACKWSLQNELDSGHPYRFSCP